MRRNNSITGRIKELVDKIVDRLPGSVKTRFLEALEKYNDTLDPALLYHAFSILDPEYYEETTSYEFPGFFKEYSGDRIRLPEPRILSGTDTLVAIRKRRSRREYEDKPLSLGEVSTILFYATGITGWDSGWPLRPYPSAGGLQPAETYLYANNVDGLDKGLYHYNPREHALVLLKKGDFSLRLYRASLSQDHVLVAPASIILTAIYPRTASKYGSRSYRYIHMDIGGVIENIYLVAEALGLATVCVGAFYDHEISEMLGLEEHEVPMAILPVGHRRTRRITRALRTIEEAVF